MQVNPSDATLEEMARELGIDPDDLKQSRFFDLIKGTFPVYIMNLTRKTAPYGGDILQDHLGAAVTLVNNTLLNHDIIVPAGKRWYLFGGRIFNGDDVERACQVVLLSAEAVGITVLLRSQAIAAGAYASYPNGEASVLQTISFPLPMAAGTYLRFGFEAGGASAGGTGYCSAILIEVDE